MHDPKSAEAKLAALRQRFALSLPRRVEAIREALDTDAVEANRLYHSLAGTAGTYGFHAISDIARSGEEHRGDDASILAELDAAVAAMPECAKVPDIRPAEPAPEESEEPQARILCLEDDPDQAAYISSILQSASYTTAVAHDVAEFERIVERFRPDLLLLDITLPDGNGLDLAAALRRVAAHAALPIIFLTGRSSTNARLAGLRAGADDYLVKPVNRDLLLGTIAARLERAQSVRTLIERDGLTQAVTRASFLNSMELAVQELSETGLPCTLVMLDIDHFKNINDQYGHLTGDRVLSLFGRFLRTNVRIDDVVGRCGGEEFGILLSGVKQEDARVLIERLLDRFGRIPHAARNGARFHVTFSGGVATLEEGEDVDSWRQRADEALYAAKRGGRARVAAA